MTDETKRNNPKSAKSGEQTRTLRSPVKNAEGAKYQDEEAAPKKQFWVQIRLLPIWLRIILVLLLLIGAAILDAIIGYGYIGDGEPADVFKKETWIHILDIIKGKES